jgi:hypothetical protein
MDDLLTGADSITELLRLREDVTHILKQGHFELRTFQSNDIRALPTNENSDPNLGNRSIKHKRTHKNSRLILEP